MRRFIMKDLLEWKNRPGRKPLILDGARQVGKTFIVEELGRLYYDNMVTLNFDADRELASLFEKTKDPYRIMEQISVGLGQKITPGRTLIFFDEIQECPNALNSLKYFCEDAPEYHVIAAGSLLGIRMAKTPFPVGKVDFLRLYPMSFLEFLLADGNESWVEYLQNLRTVEPGPIVIEPQLTEKLKTYFVVGGMPEVVQAWTVNKDIVEVKRIQENILRSYEGDFNKHTTEAEANKISLIWKGIPSQLARENKKFIYQAVHESARAREYESSLNWLRDAGIVEKIPCVKAPKLPLRAYEDLNAFKIYLLDVGLLCNMSGIGTEVVLHGDQLFSESKGALTENYVLQSLRAAGDRDVFYYTFDNYENDFLIQGNGRIYPVEVKSGERRSHKSLTKYIEKYQPDLGIRFSSNHLAKDGEILNIPLWMAECWKNFI